MAEFYFACEVCKNFASPIDSIAATEDGLIVGTRKGELRMYSIKLTEQNSTSTTDDEDLPPQLLPANLLLIKSSRTISSKPIVQLAVVKELDIIIILTDTMLRVHSIKVETGGSSDFDPVQTMSNTKGATVFDVYYSTKKDRRCRLCAVVRQKLLIFQWDFEKRHFAETSDDLQLPEIPRLVRWIRNDLYVAVDLQYQRLRLNGDFEKLFNYSSSAARRSGQAEPLITAVQSDQIAFGHDDKSAFFSLPKSSMIKDHVLVWRNTPTAMCEDAPFLIAGTSGAVEIRPSIVVKSDQPHATALPSQTFDKITNVKHVAQMRHGHVLIANEKNIWLLVARTPEGQIDKLTRAKHFELAEAVARSYQSDSDHQRLITKIRNMQAMEQFCDGKFEEALNFFLANKTVPVHVLGMFPGLLPEEMRAGLQYPRPLPTLSGVEKEKALAALSDVFLKPWRRELLKSIDKAATNLEREKTERLAVIVDTALLKCYLEIKPQILLYFLNQPGNRVDFVESEKALKKYGRLEELVLLYKARGHHKTALKLLLEEALNPKSSLGGAKAIISYLQTMPNEFLETMIFDTTTWLLKHFSIREVFEVFAVDLPDCELRPPERIVEYFERVGAHELQLPYLEFVIETWKNQSPELHTLLATLYVQKVEKLRREYEQREQSSTLGSDAVSVKSSLRSFFTFGSQKSNESTADRRASSSSTTTTLTVRKSIETISNDNSMSSTKSSASSTTVDSTTAANLPGTISLQSQSFLEQSMSNELFIVQKKCRNFLKATKPYVPGKVLLALPNDIMFFERALVLKKMGKIEQALAFLVHVLDEHNTAVAWCEEADDDEFQNKLKQKADNTSKLLRANNNERIAKHGSWFFTLFKVYLQPPDLSALSVAHSISTGSFGPQKAFEISGDVAAQSSSMKHAVNLLRRYSDRFDPKLVIDLLPESTPLADVHEFASISLKQAAMRQRQRLLLSKILQAEHLQVQELRIKAQRTKIEVNSDCSCTKCGKRIGSSAFVSVTRHGGLNHYACWKQQHG